MISVSQLRQVAGRSAKADILQAIADSAPVMLPRYQINTPLRQRHFFAQIAHECDGFKTTQEYASGAAYEGRRDLGNTKKGDGKRYKGRGLIQLTGRANYKTFGNRLGIDLEGDPAQAADPALSFQIACEYWKAKNLNALADRDDVVGITRKINGGPNGLADRKAWLRKFADVFSGDDDGADARPVHLIEPEDDSQDDDPPPTVTESGQGLNVQPQTAAYSLDVKTIQESLIRVGYHEVGGADGRWGGMTAAGIAAFKNDRGLKGEPVIDAALKTELSNAVAESWTRPIAPERANLSAKDVAEKEPAVRQSLWQRLSAKVGLWFAGLGVTWSGITSAFQGVREKVEPVQEFFSDIPSYVWFVGIGGAAVLLLLSSGKVTNNLVDAKRTGKLS